MQFSLGSFGSCLLAFLFCSSPLLADGFSNPPVILSGKISSKNSSSPDHFSYVTVAEYCNFLNVVAANDPHALYDPKQASNFIIRSGDPGFYKYTSVTGAENSPVVYVTVNDAVRFCNWVENGQPSQEQDPGATERGVYELEGDHLISINATSRHALPKKKDFSATNFSLATDAISCWEAPTISSYSKTPSCHLLSSVSSSCDFLRRSNYIGFYILDSAADGVANESKEEDVTHSSLPTIEAGFIIISCLVLGPELNDSFKKQNNAVIRNNIHPQETSSLRVRALNERMLSFQEEQRQWEGSRIPFSLSRDDLGDSAVSIVPFTMGQQKKENNDGSYALRLSKEAHESLTSSLLKISEVVRKEGKMEGIQAIKNVSSFKKENEKAAFVLIDDSRRIVETWVQAAEKALTISMIQVLLSSELNPLVHNRVTTAARLVAVARAALDEINEAQIFFTDYIFKNTPSTLNNNFHKKAKSKKKAKIAGESAIDATARALKHAFVGQETALCAQQEASHGETFFSFNDVAPENDQSSFQDTIFLLPKNRDIPQKDDLIRAQEMAKRIRLNATQSLITSCLNLQALPSEVCLRTVSMMKELTEKSAIAVKKADRAMVMSQYLNRYYLNKIHSGEMKDIEVAHATHLCESVSRAQEKMKAAWKVKREAFDLGSALGEVNSADDNSALVKGLIGRSIANISTADAMQALSEMQLSTLLRDAFFGQVKLRDLFHQIKDMAQKDPIHDTRMVLKKIGEAINTLALKKIDAEALSAVDTTALWERIQEKHLENTALYQADGTNRLDQIPLDTFIDVFIESRKKADPTEAEESGHAVTTVLPWMNQIDRCAIKECFDGNKINDSVKDYINNTGLLAEVFWSAVEADQRDFVTKLIFNMAKTAAKNARIVGREAVKFFKRLNNRRIYYPAENTAVDEALAQKIVNEAYDAAMVAVSFYSGTQKPSLIQHSSGFPSTAVDRYEIGLMNGAAKRLGYPDRLYFLRSQLKLPFYKVEEALQKTESSLEKIRALLQSQPIF